MRKERHPQRRFFRILRSYFYIFGIELVEKFFVINRLIGHYCRKFATVFLCGLNRIFYQDNFGDFVLFNHLHKLRIAYFLHVLWGYREIIVQSYRNKNRQQIESDVAQKIVQSKRPFVWMLRWHCRSNFVRFFFYIFKSFFQALFNGVFGTA